MPQKSSYRPKSSSRPNSRRKVVVLSCLIAALLIAAGAGLLIHRHNVNLAKATVQTPTTSQTTSNVNYTPAPAADNSTSENTKDGTSPTAGATSSTVASVQIVNATVNNGNLHIGNLVSGMTTGNCSLTASQSGQSTVTLDSSTIRQDVNSYDCGVFNIPTSKFPTSGTWKLTLTISNSSGSASTSTNVII